MKQNKIAGFWIRLISRLVDVIIFSGLTIFIAYLVLEKINGKFQFKEPWTFYVWIWTTIFLLFLFFILVPIIFNGQTFGMLIFRIKIIFEDKNKIISILKRESVFSLAWIFNLLILLIIINHTLINKIAINQKEVNYSAYENIRIGVFTSFGSIIFLAQWIFAFSIMIRKDKIGIHDKMSNSKTVYKNKFKIINKKKPLISFKPFMVENKKVEWMEE